MRPTAGGGSGKGVGVAAVLAVGAGIAYALKRFYADADASELAFVLGPTAALAERMSGVAFEPESGVGYFSRDAAYLLVPACAGLNFTVAAFASLLVGFTARWRSSAARLLWLVVALAIAGAATPVANAVRISVDLALRRHALPDWLSRADVHRVEGVVVYLGLLGLLQVGAAWTFAMPALAGRTLALPLAAYLGIALALPWLRGAGAQPGFDHHAGVVAATSLLVTGLLAAFAAGARDRRASATRRVEVEPAIRRGADGSAHSGARSSGDRPNHA